MKSPLILSPHLFWDVALLEVDYDVKKAFVIKRVLEYGLWSDWLAIRAHYGLEQITNESLLFRDLEPRALAFIAEASNLPKQQFRCYTTKQSIPKHWNF